MSNKNNMRISYPSSEKIYVEGEINKVKVGMRKIKLLDTVTLDENGEKVFKKNNPVVVYDTSGPYSDPAAEIDLRRGLPRLRVSPDHGTAFNIAGKGLANPSSTMRAFELALRSVAL